MPFDAGAHDPGGGEAGRVPRRHNRGAHPARDTDEQLRARLGYQRVESAADGDWLVRHISAEGAVKTYRCPGCDQEIGPGIAHLVAWPADERGDLADRRHWH